MATLSILLKKGQKPKEGIKIIMRGDGDHSYGGTEGYPHIHVECPGGESAIISIKDKSIHGFLPRKIRNIVMNWVGFHEKELMENWKSLHQSNATYKQIDGHIF